MMKKLFEVMRVYGLVVGAAASLLVLYREYSMPPASRVKVTPRLTSGGIFPMIC